MSNSKQKQPNILVIWGDDIGISNLSCYTHGLMGYQTPNIDRIAKEGMMFTDSYGEQSCTAGRSSFITGQSVYRTGLSKVGIPGAAVGMSEKLVTIAALLKEQGYATGQFGKNHLGDLNHMLPTNHGFDEFFGNLEYNNRILQKIEEMLPQNSNDIAFLFDMHGTERLKVNDDFIEVIIGTDEGRSIQALTDVDPDAFWGHANHLIG